MQSIAARLFVVEDNVDALGFMVLALEQAGFVVDSTTDGLDALKRLRQQPPPRYDLVVLDLLLPRMNGLELLSEMESDAAWRDVPILIATATVVFARQFSRGRRVSVLRKPFSALQLTTAVDTLLHQRVS